MKNIIKAFLRQFKDFTVILLIICAAAGGAAGLLKGQGCKDSLIIGAILVLNAVTGALQELKAEKILGDTEDERPTPMQRRLSELGGGLCALTAGFCAVIFFGGIIRGESPGDMLLLSVSLGVAVIPESLPAIVTIMLSAGICRLSKEGIFVRRLACAECLGRIKAVFINPGLIGGEEKEELKAAGISLIDKNEEETFHKMRYEGETTAFVGDSEKDKRFMKAADVSCCLSESTDLYSASHIIFENMSSLPEAVKIGRGIYENLKKALRFLLSCNIGELLFMLSSVVIGFEIPLLAVQLLMVNLITDALPAIAIALEEPEENLTKNPPADDSRLFTAEFTLKILSEGAVIAGVTLAAFAFGNIHSGLPVGRTMAFSVLCLSQLFHGFNMRDGRLFKNRLLNLSFIFGLVIVVMAAEIPLFADIFFLTPLRPKLWADVLLLSLIPFIIFF